MSGLSDRRYAQPRALLERAAAARGPVGALAADVVDDACSQLPLDEASDADGVLRIAMEKVGRSIERIDDPDEVAARHALRRQLFADDDRFRLVAEYLVGDQRLGRAIDLGHEVVLRFLRPRMEGRRCRAPQILGGTERGALGELD